MLAATKWLSARPHPIALLLAPSSNVQARSSGPARGLGLFITRAIPAYREILREAPTILLEPTDDLPELYEHFISLREPGDDALQRRYLALSHHPVPERDARLRERLRLRGIDETSAEEMVKVASIMQTNAFNVDLGTGTGCNHRALFAQIARINHSCVPNAHVCYYPSPAAGSRGGHMVVHALRDLQHGEEVLIAYFSILLPRPERQTKAQKWGFTCSCPACDEPPNGRHEQLRKAVVHFTTKQTTLMQNRRATVKQITHLITTGRSMINQVLEEGGFRPTIPDLYDHLGVLQAKALLIQGNDTQRDGLVDFLQWAAIWEAQLTGSDSPATKKRLLKLEQFVAHPHITRSARVVATGNGAYEIEWTTA